MRIGLGLGLESGPGLGLGLGLGRGAWLGLGHGAGEGRGSGATVSSMSSPPSASLTLCSAVAERRASPTASFASPLMMAAVRRILGPRTSTQSPPDSPSASSVSGCTSTSEASEVSPAATVSRKRVGRGSSSPSVRAAPFFGAAALEPAATSAAAPACPPRNTLEVTRALRALGASTTADRELRLCPTAEWEPWAEVWHTPTSSADTATRHI